VEGLAERELHALHDAVYDQALVWVNSLKAEQKERIEGHFGPMPQKDPELQVHTVYRVTRLEMTPPPLKCFFGRFPRQRPLKTCFLRGNRSSAMMIMIITFFVEHMKQSLQRALTHGNKLNNIKQLS